MDNNEQRVNDVLSFVTSSQIGDSTDEAFLSTLGVRNFDVCIVAIGEDFQSSLETTSLLKELGAQFVVSVQSGTCRRSSCCATGQMRCSTRKNSWPNGPLSGIAPSISWTTSSCRGVSAIFEVSCRRNG